MALAAQALTLLATVLDELGLTSDSGGAQDLRLERYILAVSEQIASHCGRVFQRDAAVVERVAGFGTTRLVLARAPVNALTSISIDGTLQDMTQVSIEDAKAGIIYRASGWASTAPSLPGISQGPAHGQEEKRIVVTYDGGYVTPFQVGVPTPVRTLPYDLEDACVELVLSRWRSRGVDPRIAAEGSQNASRTVFGSELPPHIAAVLARYARIPFA